jgi:hypothetical protein
MDSAVTLSWLEMRRLTSAGVRANYDSRIALLTRQNARLEEENERLLARNLDLAAAAETWIRLYESALARANVAAAVEERTTAFSPEASSGAAVSAATGAASDMRSGFGDRAR